MKPKLSSVALSLLLTLSVPNLVRADKAMPAVTLTGHTDMVTALAFSPDGKQLASVSEDGHLKLWDLDAKKELLSVDNAEGSHVKFTPDGKTVVVCGKLNSVMVVDAASGKTKTTLTIPDLHGGPTSFDISPDGKLLAVVGNSTLCIVDLATSSLTYRYEVHNLYAVSDIAFSPDGTRVATASDDHSSLVLEIATGKILGTFDLKLNGECVLFSRDGKKLFTYSSDSILRSFSIDTGDAQTLCDRGSDNMSIGLNADGKTLVLGGSGRAPWTVSLDDSKIHDDLFDSQQFVKSAAISPDGKWIAGGANTGDIYLWKSGS